MKVMKFRVYIDKVYRIPVEVELKGKRDKKVPFKEIAKKAAIEADDKLSKNKNLSSFLKSKSEYTGVTEGYFINLVDKKGRVREFIFLKEREVYSY